MFLVHTFAHIIFDYYYISIENIIAIHIIAIVELCTILFLYIYCIEFFMQIYRIDFLSRIHVHKKDIC
jgi:hypothetical protein